MQDAPHKKTADAAERDHRIRCGHECDPDLVSLKGRLAGREEAGKSFGASCIGPKGKKGGSEISQTVQGDVSRAEGAGEDGSGKKQGS